MGKSNLGFLANESNDLIINTVFFHFSLLLLLQKFALRGLP